MAKKSLKSSTKKLKLKLQKKVFKLWIFAIKSIDYGEIWVGGPKFTYFTQHLQQQ
jgi:hypothetical protein